MNHLYQRAKGAYTESASVITKRTPTPQAAEPMRIKHEMLLRKVTNRGVEHTLETLLFQQETKKPQIAEDHPLVLNLEPKAKEPLTPQLKPQVVEIDRSNLLATVVEVDRPNPLKPMRHKLVAHQAAAHQPGPLRKPPGKKQEPTKALLPRTNGQTLMFNDHYELYVLVPQLRNVIHCGNFTYDGGMHNSQPCIAFSAKQGYSTMR